MDERYRVPGDPTSMVPPEHDGPDPADDRLDREVGAERPETTTEVKDRMADTLTISDNRTGKQYEVPITDGTIRAMDLRQIKVDPDEFGLMLYDPAFLNTASCRSAVTFIDGDTGIPPLPRLPDRATRRAEHLRRDGVPAS